jgi:ABC-2 type transport system ATP-binding protein
VLVTSHLLGELERTSDHIVVIDGGRLLRASTTSDFTQATASLAVEVTDREQELAAALAAAGLTAQAEGHLLHIDIADDETYDVVRDAVAQLGVGLIRMEQRRHRIAELLTGAQKDARQEEHEESAAKTEKTEKPEKPEKPAKAEKKEGEGRDAA